LSRARLLAATSLTTNAVVAITPQAMALLMLAPSEYAVFSLVFIALGLTFSSQLSLIVDPWVRDFGRDSPPPWASLTLVAVVLSLPAALVPLAMGYVDLGALPLVAIGVAAAQLRNGARLVHVGQSRWGTALVSDLLFLLGFLVGVLATLRDDSWLAVWIPMLVGSATAVLPQVPHFLKLSGGIEWLLVRRGIIARLWLESSVLDLAVAAPPLVLAKWMAPGQFAVVRAATSALLPVRLVLSPLRSWLGRRRLAEVLDARFRLLLVAGGLALGGSLWVGLWLVSAAGIAQDGVLPSLAAYAPAVALMALFQFIAASDYSVARARLAPRRLLVARLVDTSSQLTSVLCGYALGGLAGALGGYVVLSAASAALWWGMLHAHVRAERAARSGA
jgi:hypothetical protein